MHTHQSLWKKGKPCSRVTSMRVWSKMALYYAGGLLKTRPGAMRDLQSDDQQLQAVGARYEAPVNLAYSSRNRSAAIRIPTYSENPKAKRLEYRPPDPAANPYLAFSALFIGRVGWSAQQDRAGEPLDKNIYELPPEELKKVPNVAGSLGEALDCLEKGPRIPVEGRRVHSDFLEMWISTKRKEHDALRLRRIRMSFSLLRRVGRDDEIACAFVREKPFFWHPK